MARKLRINARFLQAQLTGVERYAACVLQNLIPMALTRDFEIGAFTPGACQLPTYLTSSRVRIVRLNITPTSIGHHFWEQFVLPGLVRQASVDILINLTNTAPVIVNKSFLTIHDLSWIENPEWFSNMSLPRQVETLRSLDWYYKKHFGLLGLITYKASTLIRHGLLLLNSILFRTRASHRAAYRNTVLWTIGLLHEEGLQEIAARTLL